MHVPVDVVLVHDAADFRVRAGILQILQDWLILRGGLELEVVAGQVTVSQRVNVGATVPGVVRNDVALGNDLLDLVNDVHLILVQDVGGRGHLIPVRHLQGCVVHCLGTGRQARNREHQHHGDTHHHRGNLRVLLTRNSMHDAHEEALHGATQTDTGKKHCGEHHQRRQAEVVGVPGSNHQQAEVTARHRSRNNPHVADEHPAANQPQVTALVQQVTNTPQRQETQQICGSKITAQRVCVLQAQEQELVDRLALAHDGSPQVAGFLARTQRQPDADASGDERHQHAGTHQTLTRGRAACTQHLHHATQEHGHSKHSGRNHGVRMHQSQTAQAHQNRQRQGQHEGILAAHHELNHVQQQRHERGQQGVTKKVREEHTPEQQQTGERKETAGQRRNSERLQGAQMRNAQAHCHQGAGPDNARRQQNHDNGCRSDARAGRAVNQVHEVVPARRIKSRFLIRSGNRAHGQAGGVSVLLNPADRVHME